MAFALLEPTLPIWLLETMDAKKWQIGTKTAIPTSTSLGNLYIGSYLFWGTHFRPDEFFPLLHWRYYCIFSFPCGVLNERPSPTCRAATEFA